MLLQQSNEYFHTILEENQRKQYSDKVLIYHINDILEAG